jgi:hypothetical protein
VTRGEVSYNDDSCESKTWVKILLQQNAPNGFMSRLGRIKYQSASLREVFDA